MKINAVGRVARGCAGVVAAASMAFAGVAVAQDSTPSSGVFKTASEIYDACSSDDESDLLFCDGFLMAAHDMMKFYGDTNMGGAKICLPKGTKASEMRDAVLDYREGSPSSLKYSAVSTVYNALTAAYPCN